MDDFRRNIFYPDNSNRLSVVDMGFDWVGVIVLHSSGVFFEPQVGGGACSHPSLEGFFLPINRAHLEGVPTGCDDGGCMNGVVSESCLMQINRRIKGLGICVDMERAQESTEAFIPVYFKKDNFFYLEFLENKKGFLILDNCD